MQLPFINIQASGYLHLLRSFAKPADDKIKIVSKRNSRDLKMRKLVDKWNPFVLHLFCTLKLFQILKIKPKEDGWRRVSRTGLRTEPSKFCLTVFRLNIWSDIGEKRDRTSDETKKQIIKRIQRFLRKQPTTHWQIDWKIFAAKREGKKLIDIVHAGFSDDGLLEFIVPYIDPNPSSHQLSDELKQELLQIFIRIYNETRDFTDKKRPVILRKRLELWLSQKRNDTDSYLEEARHYIERILSSTFIHFEELPATNPNIDDKRFHAPDFIKHKHPGFGLLNIHCRLNSNLDEADFWVQTSHIPIDGLPMQEVLQDLKHQWGTSGDLVFPSPSHKQQIVPQRCSTGNGREASYCASKFLDFRPLLTVRKKLNKLYANELNGDITIASMLAWGLSHHRIFKNIKFMIPINIEADDGRERTIGFIIIRPRLYCKTNDSKQNFLQFQKSFNQKLQATKARKSENYELYELCATCPIQMNSIVSKLNPKGIAELFGTAAISVIKDAEFFIPTLGDTLSDGSLAFGNFAIPTKDGGKAGSVSVKGSFNMVKDAMHAVNEVVSDFRRYI